MEYDRHIRHLKADAQNQLEKNQGSPVPVVLAYLGLRPGLSPSDPLPDQPLPVLEGWPARVQMIRKLARLGEKAPLMPLLEALTDEHMAVRVAAVRALGALGEHTPLPSLVSALQDSSWHVRAAAALALSKHPDPSLLEPLLVAAADQDEAVRASAVSALGKLGASVPISALVTALRDTEWTVREAAARALGEQGERAPVAPLLIARNDIDGAVREAAEQSLHQAHPELFNSRATGPDTQSLDPVEIRERLSLLQSSRQTDPQISVEAGGERETAMSESKIQNYKASADFPLSLSAYEGPVEKGERDPAHGRHRLQGQRIKPGNVARRSFLRHILETGLVAALILGLGLSWLLMSQRLTTDLAAPRWQLATFLKQSAPAGRLYTRVAWLSQGSKHPSLVAVIDNSGRLEVWDTASGLLLPTDHYDFNNVLAMNWIGGNLLIASLAPDGSSLALYKLAVNWIEEAGESPRLTLNRELLTTLTIVSDVQPLAAWSPDGLHIAVSWSKQGKGSVEVWDLTKLQSLSIPLKCSSMFQEVQVRAGATRSPADIPARPGIVTALAWTTQGEELVTACANKYKEHIIERWNSYTGKPATLLGPELAQYRAISAPDRVVAMAWSPDENYLAYLLRGGEVILWAKDSQVTTRLDYNTSDHQALSEAVLAWSADSQHIAATIADGAVEGWDVSGNALYTYTGHTQSVLDIAWSEDGKRIASVGKDGTLQIWGQS
jgi:hypothetical protein